MFCKTYWQYPRSPILYTVRLVFETRLFRFSSGTIDTRALVCCMLSERFSIIFHASDRSSTDRLFPLHDLDISGQTDLYDLYDLYDLARVGGVGAA